MLTNADIAALARAAGLAGRGWMDWTSDDVVQDYVMEHGADSEAWEAAYAGGLLERRRTIEGWIEHWTTAPADYDAFGTTTLAIEGDWRGRLLRRVLVHPHHDCYQVDRYGSGLHGAWDEDPREIDRRIADQVARERALAEQREADRAAGLAWLSIASEADLEAALEAGEDPRGIARADVRTELRRREEPGSRRPVRPSMTAAARWSPRRGPGGRRRAGPEISLGSRPGTPIARLLRHLGRRGAAQSGGRDGARAGARRGRSLEFVAKRLEEGTLRGARAADVPPEPVLWRIGHERLADVRRIETAGRVVWVGRPTFAQGGADPR